MLSERKKESFLDPSTKIWRYMDFTKFISMLTTSSLYFARLNQFEDPYEGTELPSLRSIRERVQHNFKSDVDAKETIRREENMHRNLMKFYAVNCWHENDFESAAMWSLYLKSNEGVAICTSVDNLNNCFVEKKIAGKARRVRYTDFDSEPIPDPFNDERGYLKRKSFEHEKEVRVIISDCPEIDFNAFMEIGGYKVPDPVTPGIERKVDLNILIDSIYVAPKAPKWFFDLVKTMLKDKFGLNKSVLQSSLYDGPLK